MNTVSTASMRNSTAVVQTYIFDASRLFLADRGARGSRLHRADDEGEGDEQQGDDERQPGPPQKQAEQEQQRRASTGYGAPATDQQGVLGVGGADERRGAESIHGDR